MTSPLPDPQRTADLNPAPNTSRLSVDLATDGGTLAASSQSGQSVERAASPPGYEILGELGRGGMGVVYKARQIKANRLVALKMILTGGHAGEEGLARFQREAHAIAALQHPHIVQVFEVGEHDGLPFFSLEFCAGGSLDRKLAGTPLPPMEAASLLETLARATDAAHQAGVIHRDLKPANVLLSGSEESGQGRVASGERRQGSREEPSSLHSPLATHHSPLLPKITDFGLARKMDDVSGPTQEGAIVGTPSYMAPEQASGKSRELGPATDVYALGAILYECLTGRPPFRAATLMDTILQVISDEPVPPSQLQSRTPRDLETICLKCLQKDPGKRYGSAQALAEDLGRYRRGEPITARPVGRVERAWRWCRRNPAVASLLAVVAVVLLAATAVSWGFTLELKRRAEAEAEAKGVAQRNEETANQEKAAAVTARNDLQKANTELTRSQEALLKSTDSLVTSVARSLVRPLALEAKPNQPLPPLSGPEIGALWEVASGGEDRLRVRFFEEALREPDTTRQLRDRAEVALQAGLGLNRQLRAQVEQLLGRRLLADGIPQEEREQVAFTLGLLGIQDRDLRGKTAATLIQAMSRTSFPAVLQDLSRNLSAVAAGMDHREASEIASTLTQAMSTTLNMVVMVAQLQSLSAVATRMEPREAAVVCGRAATTFIQGLSRNSPTYAMEAWPQSLSAVAARMEPQEVSKLASALTQAMGKNTHPTNLEGLAQGLSALAAHLERREASVACGQALATLTRAMSDPGSALSPAAVQLLSRGLPALAARLDRREAAEAVTTLIQAMSKDRTRYAREGLARGLSAVAARLEPREAARACGRAADALAQAPGNPSFPIGALDLQGLSTLAPYLDPEDAARAARTLESVRLRSGDLGTLRVLSQVLPAVAARLEPGDATSIAGRLISGINWSAEADQMRLLAEMLSAVAVRMEPTRAAFTLTERMFRTSDSYTLGTLAGSLCAVVVLMGPVEAAGHCGNAAAALTQAMGKTTDPDFLGAVAKGLAAMRGPPEARETSDAVLTLIQAMSRTTDSGALRALLQVLSAVAARLEGREAAVACGQAAATLIQAMSRTTDPAALQVLTQSLSVVLQCGGTTTSRQRLLSVTATVSSLAAPCSPVAALAFPHSAMRPLPPPLPAQTLVDILKTPFCVGEARRLVLDQLSRHHGRPFADQWEFVEYVHQHRLDLDLTTPPARPAALAGK